VRSFRIASKVDLPPLKEEVMKVLMLARARWQAPQSSENISDHILRSLHLRARSLVMPSRWCHQVDLLELLRFARKRNLETRV
jgi:hypothetical protein